jgi:hypothetical protein
MTKAKKIFIGVMVVVVVALLGAAAGYWLTWTGSSKDIETVANQFKADSSWELKRNRVEPPRNICIDVKCPEVARTWTLEKTLSGDELINKLSMAGWTNVELENPACFERLKTTENNLSCSAYGEVEKYTVQVYVDNNDTLYKKPSVAFFIYE